MILPPSPDPGLLQLRTDYRDDDLWRVGGTFRSMPEEVEPITANLNLANMDFADFADSVGADGIFRGF